MEEIVVVMSPNQADDLDDYTTFEFESAPHLNETFMSQVGAIYSRVPNTTVNSDRK